MAGTMNRIHDAYMYMPPGVIEDLDERYPVGVLGQDAGGWGYITMGPDRNPDSMPSDGWGLYHPPEYYYYMDPPSTTTTPATTQFVLLHVERSAVRCDVCWRDGVECPAELAETQS